MTAQELLQKQTFVAKCLEKISHLEKVALPHMGDVFATNPLRALETSGQYFQASTELELYRRVANAFKNNENLTVKMVQENLIKELVNASREVPSSSNQQSNMVALYKRATLAQMIIDLDYL